jgi:hypothetical protein
MVWLFAATWQWVMRWSDEECSICLTPYRLHARVGKCQHGFCVYCVDTLYYSGAVKCPLCRGEMELEGWD